MQCPVCKAENSQGPHCRRCRADLALLFSLEEERTRLLARVKGYVRQNQGQKLKALVDRLDLGHDQQALRWRALSHLLNRNFPLAWQIYRQL